LEQDRHWPTLLAAMERQDLASDERFLKVGVRAKNCEALVAVFDEIFSTRTYDDWVARFDANDVWWAPINSIADVLQDTQAIASGAFIDMPVTDGEAPYQGVASPLDFSDYAFVAGEVRALGSDNDTVL
jgi:crotonobetainyl-CoA:carnitine CoA-transferase CaiB-like acyl-CoA transferase